MDNNSRNNEQEKAFDHALLCSEKSIRSQISEAPHWTACFEHRSDIRSEAEFRGLAG